MSVLYLPGSVAVLLLLSGSVNHKYCNTVVLYSTVISYERNRASYFSSFATLGTGSGTVPILYMFCCTFCASLHVSQADRDEQPLGRLTVQHARARGSATP